MIFIVRAYHIGMLLHEIFIKASRNSKN